MCECVQIYREKERFKRTMRERERETKREGRPCRNDKEQEEGKTKTPKRGNPRILREKGR